MPIMVILAALLAACGSVSSGTPDSASTRADLEGSWHLVSGRDTEGRLPRFAGRQITLVVDSRGAGGLSACNHYGVTLTVDDDKVDFTGAYGTEMACEPEVMTLEQRYLAALDAVERAERAGGELTLSGPGATLRFELDEPVRDSALVGTTWLLESLVQGDGVSSTLPGGELRFHENGSFTGTSGCRPVRGRYELVDDTVTVGEFAADPAEAGACPPQEEAQHSHVCDVLDDGFRAEIEGDRLTLTSKQGLGLQFRAG
jgi:heat shock protein HslJ